MRDHKDSADWPWPQCQGAKVIFFWTPSFIFYVYFLPLERRNSGLPLTGQTTLKPSQRSTLLLCREVRTSALQSPQANAHPQALITSTMPDDIATKPAILKTLLQREACHHSWLPDCATVHRERTRSFHTIYSKKPSVRFYDSFCKKHKPKGKVKPSATPQGRGTLDQYATSHMTLSTSRRVATSQHDSLISRPWSER